MPKEGIDAGFDKAWSIVEKAQRDMDDYLKYLRQKIQSRNPKKAISNFSQIRFVHARYKYEIEIPN